ncbi:MAG: YggS family pyridoxal phosphate-dependent enzyme [Chloroflexota bacterium]
MLEQNLKLVQQRIAHAAERAGREPREITLVAVSKTFSAEAILAAHALGVRHFGENRVEEAAEKIPPINRRLQTAITWHLIGHLQSRKVKDAVPLFDFIHSLDRVALAQKIENRASATEKTIPILLEVNISGEASKNGFAPEPREQFFDAVRTILTLPHLDAQGLMTIAPIVAQPDDARPHFRALRALRDELRARFPERAWQHLSMGMTDDFEAAIAEGATIVRIGRAIFGERNP